MSDSGKRYLFLRVTSFGRMYEKEKYRKVITATRGQFKKTNKRTADLRIDN